MNSKNALGFLILGFLMHTTPLLAQSLSNYSVAVVDGSVRTVWLELMGWVIGGIGLGYLMRATAARMPVLFAAVMPERQLGPSEQRGTTLHLPVGSQVGLSS